jgi:Uma2 family endonuclease
MALAQEQPMTLEAFLELPEEKPALEYEDGKVIQKVPPQTPHAVLQPWICELINRALRPPKIALALSELRTTYAGRSTVPDISVVAWARIPRRSDGKIGGTFGAPPDVAIEIVSPGQSTNALVKRSLWYVANGVRAALLVDPNDESVLVFRPDALPQPIGLSDEIDLGDLIPGLVISASELFSILTL